MKNLALNRSLLRRVTILAIGGIAAGLLTATAQERPNNPRSRAGGPPAGAAGGGQMYERLDANGDGKISLQEFLAAPFAAQNEERAKTMFSEADKDGDGYLTREELTAFMAQRAPNAQGMRERMANNQERLRPGQAGPAPAARGRPQAQQEGRRGPPQGAPAMGQMWERIDTDGDGKISLQEFLASPMGERDEARAKEMFSRADKDGDGYLSREELRGILDQRQGAGANRPARPQQRRGGGSSQEP